MNPTECAAERDAMLDQQIAARGIRDERILGAMRSVPRHLFVPPDQRQHAYDDRPLNIGSRQTISQPYMVAHMTSMLNLHGAETVLEIGTGSGYQTAVLSLLARHVYTIERHQDLADTARTRLERLGYGNITVICGDGSQGYPAYAPYDSILVTAAAPEIPYALLEQLADGGRIVCPVGGTELQKLMIYYRSGDNISTRGSIDCVFVPLVGKSGWSEDQAKRWRDRP
jgi:protein-L-isoaspartate(D-aspartate) O-methyltransferase